MRIQDYNVIKKFREMILSGDYLHPDAAPVELTNGEKPSIFSMPATVGKDGAIAPWRWDRIRLIKDIRWDTRWGLRESKEFVDQMIERIVSDAEFLKEVAEAERLNLLSDRPLAKFGDLD